MKPKYRFQWYQEIYNNLPKILEEAEKVAKELDLDKLKNKIGLYPGSSSCPGSLPKYVLDENAELNEELARLGVRSLVRAVEIVCKYAGLEE